MWTHNADRENSQTRKSAKMRARTDFSTLANPIAVRFKFPRIRSICAAPWRDGAAVEMFVIQLGLRRQEREGGVKGREEAKLDGVASEGVARNKLQRSRQKICEEAR